ncbi:L,D-transpeptidase [Fulvimarina sp. 2208YS6-2-32]|uniref:L,D-transpeptidase n=1 Tax=Fulvimarina uroteuthidis TaxID=3098149 RepID=A0ABU5I5A5_9HYPH|nr:L,D-transpeptidase [Fulvimarina sp. 2208YS6-2-32]MDY8110580.1 L,D-transpeptidase [Fulvimarina sp. 2208YS6-2-32]
MATPSKTLRGVLAATTAALCLSAAAERSMAQGFIPQGVPPQAVESYVDQYGREIFLDLDGRVVAVVQPEPIDRFEERRLEFDDRRGQVFDRPPPPGVTLEGPANIFPGGPLPRDNFGGFEQPVPQTADPYDSDPGYQNAPIEASPLPSPSDAAPSDTIAAELPQTTGQPSPDAAGSGLDLPNPDASIVDRAPSTIGEAIDQPFVEQTIQETDPAPQVATPQGSDKKAAIAALQVILDRAGMSPGVIDGRMGSNVNKAVAAYQEKYGRTLSTGDSSALADELDATGGPAVTTYELTSEDVSGPYVASIPTDYAEKAKMPEMSFVSPAEKLAEKFHMDEEYLKAINPGADFTRAGTRIKVMNVGENVTGKVARIVADKGREQVRVYDAMGDLIAAYPSTIGSSSTPSPSGTVQVNRIAFDPNYTYNPKINFKQGENDKVLTIPPGPNGPVGSVWIALSKPTYGIHGTPEPSKIGKTNSHGCVRLTNWDAFELAKMVQPGATVEFVE